VILEDRHGQSTDADDYTVILTAGSSPLRGVKGQSTVW
jgi:hypothetical protein